MRKESKDEVLIEEEELGGAPAKNSRQTLKYIRYLLLLVRVMVALIFLFLYRDEINGDNFRRLIAKIAILLTFFACGFIIISKYIADKSGKTEVFYYEQNWCTARRRLV